MKTRCNTCKTIIDFSNCYFIDNDNIAVCKDCYDTKKYDIFNTEKIIEKNKTKEIQNEKGILR